MEIQQSGTHPSLERDGGIAGSPLGGANRDPLMELLPIQASGRLELGLFSSVLSHLSYQQDSVEPQSTLYAQRLLSGAISPFIQRLESDHELLDLDVSRATRDETTTFIRAGEHFTQAESLLKLAEIALEPSRFQAFRAQVIDIAPQLSEAREATEG